MSTSVYTYRCGQKITLEKRTDQFVVRALPEALKQLGYEHVEQVSSASCRVTTTRGQLEAQMSFSRHQAPTHHAYLRSETGEEFLITDRLFVQFKEALTNEQFSEFLAKYSLRFLQQISPVDYLVKLTDHTGMNPLKLVCKLMEEEEQVANADHDLNFRMQKYSVPIPIDPEYQKQWHLHRRLTNPELDQRASSRCEEAWQLLESFGNPDVVVSFTDDGCRLDHPDFDDNKFVDWGYLQGTRLVTKNDFDARADRMYISGANHGTSVGGVIAAETDATHTVGAAPGCRMLPVKWESEGPYLYISDSKLLTVLDYVANKVDVISNSWGSSPVNDFSQMVVDRITELAVTGGRRGKGIVFLWAAGNENCPIEYLADQNVPYTPGWNGNTWVGVRTARQFSHNLVDVNGVMYVAALASTAQRSHYSNYGPGISICAPTNNVHTYYRLRLDGLGITTTTGAGNLVTDYFGGTSSACPLVAGIAGLVISANQELSALEVISILKLTASKDLNMRAYPRTPPASYNQDTSWDVSPIPPFNTGAFTETGAPEGSWSPWFGHGKVDALEAVSEALRRVVVHRPDTVKVSTNPEMVIPDNTPSGIQHRLMITESGLLKFIKVDVNIEHTYIGDLRVSLWSPSGTEVVLHNRSGSSQNDLVRSYEPDDTPALARLINESISGEWGIWVQDLAARDTGILKTWGLEIELESKDLIIAESAPGLTIPDNNTQGISNSINVTSSGSLVDLEVVLDITHSYIGDLSVRLATPDGAMVFLHNRGGGNEDNIIRSYKPADSPDLRGLLGRPIQGDWRLVIIDHATRDVGKLNSWKLLLRV